MSYKKYELSKSLDNKKSCSLLIKIVIKQKEKQQKL